MSGEREVMICASWKKFLQFRKEAEGPLGALLRSPNPEVVLSVPDLYIAAREAFDAVTQDVLGRALATGDYALAEEANSRWEDTDRETFFKGVLASKDFLSVLNWFFAAKHYEDSRADLSTREYLRRELDRLKPGDIVITTNWDTLAERILAETGQWTPADGYGFPISLEPLDSHTPDPAAPPWVPSASRIRVLKLHGSFGWREKTRYGPAIMEKGTVYLESEFLRYLPIKVNDKEARFRDGSEPDSYDPSNEPDLVYPSYLKRFVGSTRQRIWFEAAIALEKADQVRVVGASLPEADIGVRTLLNPLRFRLENNEVSVIVHDPLKKTLERWKHFLGENVITRLLRAGE